MTAEPKKSSARGELTALVAGGAGFIGSYLCEALLTQGYRVYCLDNLTSGSKENIKDLLTKQNFHFVEADITTNVDVLAGFGVLDVVFHLAALEEGATSDLSLETLLVNSAGTRNLLELAKKFKSKFILVSSGEIYQGSFSSNNFKNFFGGSGEEATLTQHEAKRFAEALTVEYFKKYHLPASIVRVSDVYGPRMNLKTNSDLARLIQAAQEKEKLVIKGDGLATLNPTYITDAVFGILKAAQGNYPGEIFNVISSEKTTLTGLAETLRLVAGDLEIVHEDSASKIDFPPSPLDLESTRERLKWTSKVSLAEGLSSTVQTSSQGVPAKMVDLAPETKVSETKEERRVSHQSRNYLRVAIFCVSLLLIVFTTLIPLGLFIFQERLAVDKLSSAYTNLEADKREEAALLADSAQKTNQSSQKSLNNVRWLFQIFGQRGALRADEQLLFGSENTIVGVRLLAQVEKAIVEAAAESDKEAATSHLREAKQYLDEASQNLDLAGANLEAINKKSLTAFLGSSLDKLRQIDEKAAKNALSTSTSLAATLEKIEAASTAP